MVKVSVEVRRESACFKVAVWAESIEHALNLTNERYLGCEAKVLFPIDPEAFFVENPYPHSGMIMSEVPEEMVG